MIQKSAIFGSVNAHREDWSSAVSRLSALAERWPDAAAGLVGLRVEPGRFQEAFEFDGVKATLRFA